VRPVSGSSTSLLVPCEGVDRRRFLLKFFIPPAEGRFYPPEVNLQDYARREGAFYRFLDTVDPDRTLLPSPRTVLIDTQDPPRWILLERIPGAIGPAEEVLGMDHVFELLQKLQSMPFDRMLGRRHFPLNHWDPVGYHDRARWMYDPVLFVVGERRWSRVEQFLREAIRWTDARAPVLVHGDFTELNILVDDSGRPFLLDFERVGIGSRDHDFAWFWIHCRRSQDWKVRLLKRYFGERVGSDRVRTEWAIRAALVYLALRRLRFQYLVYGDEDPGQAQNLGLLDAALEGGKDLFPI
jgi:aminoglycoside phosphotransferase (APT) family kinase protein